MSFRISSWYSSALVFFFFFGRGPRGTDRRAAAAAAAARGRAMVSEVFRLSLVIVIISTYLP